MLYNTDIQKSKLNVRDTQVRGEEQAIKPR